MTAMAEPTEPRFVVRRRADGWGVFDTEHFVLPITYPTERAAKKAAAWENAPKRTYGITWYVEVDAPDEATAVTIATNRFIAPEWRDGWQPHAITEEP